MNEKSSDCTNYSIESIDLHILIIEFPQFQSKMYYKNYNSPILLRKHEFKLKITKERMILENNISKCSSLSTSRYVVTIYSELHSTESTFTLKEEMKLIDFNKMCIYRCPRIKSATLGHIFSR